MSIAQHGSKLHPVYLTQADPTHHIVLSVVADPEAPLGDIDVSLDRGPYAPDTIDPTEYVAALRQFAAHLSIYADAYEYAASVEF